MKKSLLSVLIVLVSVFTTKAQLTESFDGANFPPAGWLNVHTIGADGTAIWSRAAAGAFGGDVTQTTTFNVDPHSGAGMASFRSWDFLEGNGAHLITSAVNLSTGGPHLIKFWMYRDNVYAAPDSISVYINTAATVTGASFLGKILRKKSYTPAEVGADGWYQYSFDIPAGFNSAANYFIFSAVGSYGNNMFIDDVTVASQPSCIAPTGVKLSNFNYAAGTGNGTWTASTSGSATGYEWTINTTGIIPVAAGTAVAGNSASITGITPNVVNYIFVRTNCGGGSYSTWSALQFSALPCATLTAPANGATGVPQSQAFSWSAVTGATAYNFYLGTSAGGEINIGTLAGTSTPVSNLLPGQTYYWYIVPLIGSTPSLNTSCSSSSFTIAVESNSTVGNNSCSGATTINASNIAGSPVSATTINATLTLPADICANEFGSADDDVWFQFTTAAGTPPTGILTITPLASGGISDIVAQIYAGATCATLGAPVLCADLTTDALEEVINLNLLSANTHYYMRVFSFLNTPESRGGFTITASAGNTLPVNLANFSARRSNSVNILNWSTQQETNTRHFVVERSKDGTSYSGIGQVTATGNSTTIRNYSFTDNHPVNGINYYRLRTVDNDNSFKLSDVRSIRNEGLADITIYPNPVKDRLILQVNADKAASGKVVILDVSGKIVYQSIIKIGQGNNMVPIAADAISAGSYIIKIQLNNDLVVKKFNKL